MFPCTQCGLCCQNISNIEELVSYDLGNGVCKYFDMHNNICAIYETRPTICRVDTMFDMVYSKFYTIEDFYIVNAHVCNKLQDQYNMNEKFKIKLGE